METKNLTPEFKPELTINFTARELNLFKKFIDVQIKVTKHNLEDDTDELLRNYRKRNDTEDTSSYLDLLVDKILENKRLIKVLEFTAETIEDKYKIQ